MKRKASSWFTLSISLFLLMASISGGAMEANAAGKQPAASSADAIKLAILVPLTGPSFLGIPARDGALLAISQRNASGGILGMNIEPVVEDTACNATTAVAATNKVINQDGVGYVIGDACSSTSIPMSEIANAAGVIQMTPSATNPQVTVGLDDQVKVYIFRACFIDPFQAAAAARFARSSLSAQTAFIMLDPKNAYSQGLADAFQAEFSRAGAIVGKEAYNASDTNFSAILAKIQQATPDVVYLPDYANVVNLVTQQAKALNITTPFIGGDGWDSSSLDTEAASGSYFTNHMSFEDPRPEVSAFAQAFTSQYGHAPDTVAALAYDAANLLFQAMQEAGTTDTAAVKTTLAAINFQGVTGSLFYDTSHNGIKSAAVLRVQADGAHFYALVAPNKPAADLTINYNTGSPGSSFTVAGSNFPPNATGSITINGVAAGTIPVDGAGGFVFLLNTAAGDAGRYAVTVSVNPKASAGFTLDAAAPLRPAEGSGPEVVVPGGIAYTRFSYLPLIQR
jgi:branched-chain amino acid transport system substrate-binding protein